MDLVRRDYLSKLQAHTGRNAQILMNSSMFEVIEKHLGAALIKQKTQVLVPAPR